MDFNDCFVKKDDTNDGKSDARKFFKNNALTKIAHLWMVTIILWPPGAVPCANLKSLIWKIYYALGFPLL